MTAVVTRVVLPTHELVIQGSDAGKVGSCRCGAWSFTAKVSTDAVTNAFVSAHLVELGDARPGQCARGCSGRSTVGPDGELRQWATCSCRLVEVAAAGEVSGWSDGHPRRRGEPGRPGAVVVAR